MRRAGLCPLILLGLTSGAASAQLSIIEPPSRVTVPFSGSAVDVDYSGVVPGAGCPFPATTVFDWTRDGANPKTCAANQCTVTYFESASTRGTHVAHADVSYLLYGGQSCIAGAASKARTYVVQYQPTGSIDAAPATLTTNDIGQFSGSGQVDTQYSVDNQATLSWDFDDGYLGFGANDDHKFFDVGTYEVKLTVSDGFFEAEDSTTVTVIVPPGSPSAPTMLSATQVEPCNGDYRVRWTSVSGATSYELARKIQGASYFSSFWTGTATAKKDTVYSGFWQEYKVRACNANGCGLFSSSTTLTYYSGCS